MTQAIKIASKIVGYSVDSGKPAEAVAANAPVVEVPQFVSMNETLERPDMLIGSTYKIKPPVSDHAMYVTINDIVLNEGTKHEQRRPFEIFINSKNLEHFQWIIALTRIMSAVFRKGGDVTFLVEEMKAVFDPKGGYWLPKGKGFVPSIVAELGMVIENHLKMIGMLAPDELDEAQKRLIQEKREAFEALTKEKPSGGSDSGNYPASATMCPKCSVKSMILMDGCQTCLNCAHSKCQ